MQTTCVLVGPHQLPTHFTLLGKSDGRMKTLLADVVLARAFGVGGVGNSVSSQFAVKPTLKPTPEPALNLPSERGSE